MQILKLASCAPPTEHETSVEWSVAIWRQSDQS